MAWWAWGHSKFLRWRAMPLPVESASRFSRNLEGRAASGRAGKGSGRGMCCCGAEFCEQSKKPSRRASRYLFVLSDWIRGSGRKADAG